MSISIVLFIHLYSTKREALTVLLKARRKRLERSVGRNTRRSHQPPLECFSRFLSALQQNRAQSRLPYLFYNKEFVTLPTHYIQFSKANNTAARTLHNIARYNKPIRILVRIVQIIGLVEQD